MKSKENVIRKTQFLPLSQSLEGSWTCSNQKRGSVGGHRWPSPIHSWAPHQISTLPKWQPIFLTSSFSVPWYVLYQKHMDDAREREKRHLSHLKWKGKWQCLKSLRSSVLICLPTVIVTKTQTSVAGSDSRSQLKSSSTGEGWNLKMLL